MTRHKRAEQRRAERRKLASDIPKAKRPGRSRQKIVANTREMLAMAKVGYEDAIAHDPRRRRAGIMNMFTYGRSVTLVMQTMRNSHPDFDAWWQPYQEKFANDPLMRFANDARNAILKEGSLATSNSTYVEHLDGDKLADFSRQHSPPGTVSTFIGDQLGGNGWEVQMPDGSIQKVYFDLPDQPGLSVTSWLG
ncbi:MAG: hypothetical protein V7636_2597, partial [Actinomycetota bacterium]